MRKTVLLAAIIVAAFLGVPQPDCHAGLFLLDFAISVGEAEGWDIIDPILAEEECDYLGGPGPCTIFPLTDRAGGDDDVTLEILEIPFIGNTAPYLSEPQLYDEVEVPLEALGDYQYRNPDTAGTSAPFRLDNLNPGQYRVTVFEGRTTDGNGQFAKLWVGDADGSNEPGVPGEHDGQNTGDFAAASASLELTIGEGQYLWYRHLEDNSGGISGMIIRQLSGIDDVPGDFNADGTVDIMDYQIMTANFNADGAFAEGDINYSGHINITDFIAFRELYNAQAPPATAVPEPAAGLSALIAFLALLRVARRPR